MTLRSVNLNLFPILQALLRERSVAATAVALDMSPAATSEALGRLRVLLDDPLLVRVGRNLRLTPKAFDLIGPVNRLCDEAQGLLQRSETFDPLTSNRKFKIATNDALALCVAKRVLDAVRAAAPSMQVHFSDPHPDFSEQMASREIDCLLMPRIFLDELGASIPIRTRTLFRDRLVVAFSDRHPLAARAEITREELGIYPQVLYNPSTIMLEGRREREAMGDVAFNVAARVSQLSLIPHLVVEPPNVCWIPLSLANFLRDQLHLQTRELPMSLPDIDVFLAWSPVHHIEPAHRWFRELLIGLLASVASS